MNSSPEFTTSKTPSMFAGWMPWKWIECGCEPGVDEADAQNVVLGRTDHRPRHGAVVRPGGEEDARGDLDLAIDRAQRVLAHAAGLVRQRLRWVEQRVEIARPTDGRSVAADHRRVTQSASGCARAPAACAGCFRITVERQFAEHGRSHERAQHPRATACA